MTLQKEKFMGFDCLSATDVADFKVIRAAFIITIITFINIFVGGILIMAFSYLYLKRSKADTILFVKCSLGFFLTPFIIIGGLGIIAAFA